MADIVMIGVPFDSNGRPGGTGGFPAAMRREGLVQLLRAEGMEARDDGDVPFATPVPERDSRSGIIAVDAVVEIAVALRQRVGQVLAAAGFPLVVAGECSALFGCLAAVRDAAGRARLLFVDGHEDAWTPWGSVNGDVADMELGLALGRETDGLPLELGGLLPLLEPQDVVVLGARDGEEMAEAGMTSILGDVLHFTDEQLAADAAGATSRALGALSGSGAGRWLHVDLDVLATAALPAVDARQPGGIAWGQLEAIVIGALASGLVLGMDVTIFNPDLDPTGEHARRVAACLARSLGTSRVACARACD
jgi:arginase